MDSITHAYQLIANSLYRPNLSQYVFKWSPLDVTLFVCRRWHWSPWQVAVLWGSSYQAEGDIYSILHELIYMMLSHIIYINSQQ